MNPLPFALSCFLLCSNPVSTINEHLDRVPPNFRNTPPAGSLEFFEVVAVENGIRSHLVFNGAGDVVRCQRYYQEKDLSPFVAAKVKYRFPGFTIFGVTEVTTSAGVRYTVIIEDPRYWIHVESTDNGLLTVKKKYKKA